MEPVRAFENFFPIDRSRLNGGKARIGTVIDDFASTLRRTCFEEVNADAFAAARDVLGADSISAQGHQTGIAQIIFGKTRDELDIFSVVCQRDSDVRFAAAVNCFERTSLGKTLKAWRRKAEHDLAEGDYFFHGFSKMLIRGGFVPHCQAESLTYMVAENQL